MMNYQKIIIAGNATKNAQRRISEKGDVSFTTFSVGVSDRKDQSIYFPVTVFGKYGESLVKHITKGRSVLVEGRIEVSVSDDNKYFNVVANKVRLGTPVGEVKSTDAREEAQETDPIKEFQELDAAEENEETK